MDSFPSPPPPTTQPYPPRPPRRGMSQRTKIAAAVVGCAVVAGGAYAATEAFSSSSAAPAAAVSNSGTGASQGAAPATQTSGLTGEAAVLSSVVDDSALTGTGTVSTGTVSTGTVSTGTASPGTTPSATAATPAQKKAAKRRARTALRRLRLLGGEHGEVTFATKKGTRTLAFERGTVVSVAGGSVIVKAKDGTTWTWSLVGNSVIRADGKKEATSALRAGQTVFTAGQVTGTTRDSRLVVISQKS